MEKMNEKIYKISLAAGGSHYPVINPKLQVLFAKILLQECIDEAHRRGDDISYLREYFNFEQND
jgi:hypothetical protein